LRAEGVDRTRVGRADSATIPRRTTAAADRDGGVDMHAGAAFRISRLGLGEDATKLVDRGLDFFSEPSDLQDAVNNLRDSLIEVQSCRLSVVQRLRVG